jgi:hypothetical protein
MEPLDVWTFEFEDDARADTAYSAIAGRFGPIAEIGEKNKKLVIISAPAEIMKQAAEIANRLGGKLKGPSLTWA